MHRRLTARRRRLLPVVLTFTALIIAPTQPAWADGEVVVDNGGGITDGNFGFGSKGEGSPGNDLGGGSGAQAAAYKATACRIEVLPGAVEVRTGVAPSETVTISSRWVCYLDSGSRTYSGVFDNVLSSPAPPPPPPDPAVLAQEAYSKIRFPAPTPHLAPYTQLAVKYWNYLWVDNPGELTASATAAGLTVTATATLTSSAWSMGEWRSLDDPRPVKSFTCAGGGVKPPANPEWNVAAEPSTDCAYWFRWRSLEDRTDGAGTWPVTVATTWDITWTATNGATGTATRTQTSAPVRVAVGEWRTVTVAGDGAVNDEGQR